MHYNYTVKGRKGSWAYGKEKIRGAERNLPDFFGLCPTSPEKFPLGKIICGLERTRKFFFVLWALGCGTSGVTFYQGAPVQNFRRPPSRSAKCMSRAPYMHKFSRGSRACSSGKFLNLESLKCHFLDFGERFYRILMVRKRHCNISEALANVFALSPKPGGPHWGWGPPGSPGLSP
jgi:hypothetical protein